MFTKLMDLLSLFRKGNELANSDVWKDRGNVVTLLTPFLVTLVKLAGDFNLVTVQLSIEDATAIALGIVSVVQFILHNTTSKRAGLLPAKQPAETVQTVEPNSVESVREVSANDKAPVENSAEIYRG